MDRAHLVGDRADAADARGDVRRLGELASAQERLEEARRLEYAQLGAPHLAVADGDGERPLAFDAGDVVSICSLDGLEFARGLPRFGDADIRARKTPRAEVVHRDDLVLL